MTFFTPGELPLEDSNVYATRREPEQRLTRFLQRRQIPVIYGEYGVGKTTLVARFLRTNRKDDVVVAIPSAAGVSMRDVYTRILETLEYSVETATTEGSQVAVEGGFKALVARASASVGLSHEVRRELTVTSPTDLEMLDVMEVERIVLYIDEMHNGSEDFRRELANLIKAVKTANKPYPEIIIIGTTLDSERLVAPDPDIDRYVKELPVPTLSDDEARFIVTEGFSKLALDVSGGLVEKIIRTAAGAPTIVQTVCLDMAEFADEAGRDAVTEDDYRAALRLYLDEHGRRLANEYRRAVETMGPRRYRKQILHAMAEIPTDYATLEEIREGVSRQLGAKVESTALSGPLRALKEQQYGRILQDVERYVGGDRVYNLSAFRDPMMKSFIRFMREVEAQGLTNNGDEAGP